MKFLQINITHNSGSHGKIVEGISNQIKILGHFSYISAFFIKSNDTELIKIGNNLDRYSHILRTRLTDQHGSGSKMPTFNLILKVKRLNPDLFHLHNIHGYYLNVELLFRYIKAENIPVVWTLHDCWPFTGHCSHFQFAGCNRWKTGCYDCPTTHGYPTSWFIDNSRKNYSDKKRIFNGVKRMILVSPSKWLADLLKQSFLSGYEVRIINNGIDLNKFRPFNRESVLKKYNISKKYILGVANKWTERKGLNDLFLLRNMLNEEVDIILVGKLDKIKKVIGLKHIARTEDTEELSALYSGAEVFVNPTYVDNFPSVNLEALACGTPVVTYNTGGSGEAVDHNTGIIVEKGDVGALHNAVMAIMNSTTRFTTEQCRERAEKNFSADDRFGEYLRLYDELIKN